MIWLVYLWFPWSKLVPAHPSGAGRGYRNLHQKLVENASRNAQPGGTAVAQLTPARFAEVPHERFERLALRLGDRVYFGAAASLLPVPADGM